MHSPNPPRKQILDSINVVLSSEAALNTDVAADALSAACALDGLGSLPALQLLLSTRSSYLVQQLEAATTAEVAADRSDGPSSPEGSERHLVHLARSIQTTFHQVGLLFLPGGSSLHRPSASVAGPRPSPTAGPGSCLLQATLMEDESDSSELLFSGRGTLSVAAPSGSIGGSAPAASPVSLSSSPEAEAWRRASQKLLEGLVALPTGQVEKACMAWLRDVVAAEFSSSSAHGGGRAAPLLRTSCSTAARLVEVERAVHRAIAEWRPHGGPDDNHNASSTQSHALGPNHHSSSAGGAAPHEPPQTWDAVCERVLGFPLSLWQEVFHAPFLEQCKHLVVSRFDAVVGQVLAAPLQGFLTAAASAPPQPPGHLPAGAKWPLDVVSSSALVPAGGGLDGGGADMDDGLLARSWSEKAVLASVLRAGSSLTNKSQEGAASGGESFPFNATSCRN